MKQFLLTVAMAMMATFCFSEVKEPGWQVYSPPAKIKFTGNPLVTTQGTASEVGYSYDPDINKFIKLLDAVKEAYGKGGAAN